MQSTWIDFFCRTGHCGVSATRNSWWQWTCNNEQKKRIVESERTRDRDGKRVITTSATICSSISKPDSNCSFAKLISYDVVGDTIMTRLFRVCNIFAMTNWEKQIAEIKSIFWWNGYRDMADGRLRYVCICSNYHVISQSTGSRRFPIWTTQRMHPAPRDWPAAPTFSAPTAMISSAHRVLIASYALASYRMVCKNLKRLQPNTIRPVSLQRPNIHRRHAATTCSRRHLWNWCTKSYSFPVRFCIWPELEQGHQLSPVSLHTQMTIQNGLMRCTMSADWWINNGQIELLTKYRRCDQFIVGIAHVQHIENLLTGEMTCEWLQWFHTMHKNHSIFMIQKVFGRCRASRSRTEIIHKPNGIMF